MTGCMMGMGMGMKAGVRTCTAGAGAGPVAAAAAADEGLRFRLPAMATAAGHPAWFPLTIAAGQPAWFPPAIAPANTCRFLRPASGIPLSMGAAIIGACMLGITTGEFIPFRL